MNSTVAPLDTPSLTRTGGRIGSNPAGIYRDQSGQLYYIKELESVMHARNEIIAAKLYQLAGAPTLTYIPTLNPCEIATRWITLDKKHIHYFSDEELNQAQRWFAVHAWTANWDAAGFDGDNQGTSNGTVLTLDVGGALNFRAQGDPKDKAFGNEVTELETLRTDPDNPHAVKLFGDMSPEKISHSIRLVTLLPDDRIREVIQENGGSYKLAEKMVARKAYMAEQLT